jgi:hypothetical protein
MKWNKGSRCGIFVERKRNELIFSKYLDLIPKAIGGKHFNAWGAQAFRMVKSLPGVNKQKQGVGLWLPLLVLSLYGAPAGFESSCGGFR